MRESGGPTDDDGGAVAAPGRAVSHASAHPGAGRAHPGAGRAYPVSSLRAQAPAADVIAGIKQATVNISDPPAGAPAASTAGSTLPGYTPERVLREPLAGGQLSAEEEKDLL